MSNTQRQTRNAWKLVFILFRVLIGVVAVIVLSALIIVTLPLHLVACGVVPNLFGWCLTKILDWVEAEL